MKIPSDPMTVKKVPGAFTRFHGQDPRAMAARIKLPRLASIHCGRIEARSIPVAIAFEEIFT